jgi:hypothetical protein
MRMKFRLTAFAFHLLGSACVLSFTLGALYFGWYRWPGWYLTGVMSVSALLAGVDLVVGPLLTLIIAAPAKPRRELARDISIIVAAQLVALAYGASTLWNGRPVYYAFSADRLEVVRAFELVDAGTSGAQPAAPELAPHWWSPPRWVWVPYPDDEALVKKIVASAVSGGADIIDMPEFFKPWSAGLPALRQALVPADQLRALSKDEKKRLKTRMAELGFPVDGAITMNMIGREVTLVAVFDPPTMRMKALLYTQ